MDLKYTFWNEDLDEEVYIEYFEGLIVGKDKNLVWKLKKALYGLKQPPHAWCYHLDNYLHQWVFTKWFADRNIYNKFDSNKLFIVVVYICDIIFGSNVESMS